MRKLSNTDQRSGQLQAPQAEQEEQYVRHVANNYGNLTVFHPIGSTSSSSIAMTVVNSNNIDPLERESQHHRHRPSSSSSGGGWKNWLKRITHPFIHASSTSRTSVGNRNGSSSSYTRDIADERAFEFLSSTLPWTQSNQLFLQTFLVSQQLQLPTSFLVGLTSAEISGPILQQHFGDYDNALDYESLLEMDDILQPVKNRGASIESISILPSTTYSSERNNNIPEVTTASPITESDQPVHECRICLSEYQNGEELITLPKCLHQFHSSCISKWLTINQICPVCRTSIQS